MAKVPTEHKRAKDIILAKEIVIMESEGNYTNITFDDGSKYLSSYSQAEIKRRFGIELKRVNHKVSINQKKIEFKHINQIKIMNQVFEISRRKMKNWLIAILLLFPILGISQNAAPIAVNDTLKVCSDVSLRRIWLTSNDLDGNGDMLKISYITPLIPSNGAFVFAEANSGYANVMNPSALLGGYTFNYKVRDLRFGNVGSVESNIATVILDIEQPYVYTGTYAGTNNRKACRSTTSGTVSITGKETMMVYSSAEFLPGTTITASGTGSYEVTVHK